MKVRECRFALVLMACASATQGAESMPAPKAVKDAPPNLEFLEYLGTLEHDEENWTDVINVELPRTAKAKGAAPKAKPKPEAAKSAGSDK